MGLVAGRAEMSQVDVQMCGLAYACFICVFLFLLLSNVYLSIMTGNLAQQLSLVSFGNEFLRTGKQPEDFYPKNTTFQFCNIVQFIEFKKSFFSSKLKEKVVADNPYLWFDMLRKNGCQKLGVWYEHSKDQSFAKDYMLAGFVGGGGTWLIETIYDTYSNFWSNNWTVTNKNAQDSKIWSVKYGAIANRQPTVNPKFDINEKRNELKSVLIKIRDFAKRHMLNSWADTFDKAIDTLESEDPFKNYGYHDLIDVKSHSLISQQILSASGIAYVFGGMGSWNDLGFESEDEDKVYKTLSEQLYDVINSSIIAGINS